MMTELRHQWVADGDGYVCLLCDGDRASAPRQCAGAPVPAWDPDVEQALESVGESIGQAVTPLAWALQEARDGAAQLLDRYAQTYAALAALVAALDAGTVRANWAHDQAILDQARLLVARLAPIPLTNGETDGDPTPDPAG